MGFKKVLVWQAFFVMCREDVRDFLHRDGATGGLGEL